MATRNTTPTSIPSVFASGEEFQGRDLRDKKSLVGVPFMVIGVEIERNAQRNYDVAYVSAVDAKGEQFEFSDTSSTGVKAQLQAILADKKLSPTPGDGYQSFPKGIVVMRGLRVSAFEVEDDKTGKMRDAEVYYLAGNGIKR